MRRLVLFALLVGAAVATWAGTPTTLRVVELRWIQGQPELETWLGSLQGTLNRMDAQDPVFLVRTNSDALWADLLVRQYGLKRETYTPGALLAQAKPLLTGQVRYDQKLPWTRTLAVGAAAQAPGAVIATDADLGLPMVLDLRTRWADRHTAMTALLAAGVPAGATPVLAPDSGHLLTDLITARRWPAYSLQPDTAEDDPWLQILLKGAGPTLLGMPVIPDTDTATTFWHLTGRLLPNNQSLTPAHFTPNLSCFSRFPAVLPLVQGRDEVFQEEPSPLLLLVYDGGDAINDGAQSLDFAMNTLLPLLHDPALAALPVGVETPMPLLTYAPSAYQALVVQQRFTKAELIAAPNGDGWTLPMLLKDPTAFVTRTGAQARAMDLTGIALYDLGGTAEYDKLLTALAATGMRGAILRPVAAQNLTDKQPRTDRLLPGFTALVANGRASTVSELRTLLMRARTEAKLDSARDLLTVLFLDPNGVPPAALHALLPEIQTTFTLVTPTQAFRAYEESAKLLPLFQKLIAERDTPRRGKPVLRVSTPTTTATPTADAALPISVQVTGDAPVLTARIIYRHPDGHVGAADLRQEDHGRWTTTLPPTLVGGELSIRARVVDALQLGESFSEPLTLQIPIVDSDNDGADDTLERYMGTDPQNWDTDGDGLPDGLDPHPLQIDRDYGPIFTPIAPLGDLAYLTGAGASSADANGRLIPANTAVTYKVSLRDIPAAHATLRLFTTGAGTITCNGGAAKPLEVATDHTAFTDLSLAGQTATGQLTFTLTANAAPLHLLSFGIITNPAGPYILPPVLTPTAVFAGMPIAVRVTVYCPAGVKSVKIQYGNSPRTLTALTLTPAAKLGNVVFTGEIPPQNWPSLVYNILAESKDGQIAASAFSAVAVGRTGKHTIAVLGTRDLRGDWLPSAIWGPVGRLLIEGSGTDVASPKVLLRPGKYTVWLLAQPRERGIAVSVEKRADLEGVQETYLSKTVPAGSPDGWFKLGTMTMKDQSTRCYVGVTPIGPKGYCAYGQLVFTQDETFVPPLSYAGIDWFNSLSLTGLKDGQLITTGQIKAGVRVAGNIDAVQVKAEQVRGAITSLDTYVFEHNDDGSYTLSTRGLLPGDYLITAYGMRVVRENGQTKVDPLISVNVKVTVRK